MKIWLGKLAVTYLWDRYIQFEKASIVDALANVEAEWLEASLLSSTEHKTTDEEDGDQDSDEEELPE